MSRLVSSYQPLVEALQVTSPFSPSYDMFSFINGLLWWPIFKFFSSSVADPEKFYADPVPYFI